MSCLVQLFFVGKLIQGFLYNNDYIYIKSIGMKQLLLLIFVLPLTIFAQCPPTGGVFTSQAQIDALAIDYPDCTEVGGFIISGDDITDLGGLYQINSCTSFSISNNLILQNTTGLNPNIVIQYVEGTGTSFVAQNNAALLTIDGLDNLESQSGFESDFIIRDNPVLVSIEGVPSSFNALDILTIINNDALINLNGLDNHAAGSYTTISDNDSLIDLTGLYEIYGAWVVISDNDNLQSLNGLDFSGFDDYLVIENNQSLTDISAIYAGSYVDDSLTIRNNPNLSMCSTDNVCFYIYDNGIEEGIWFPGVFENNAPGCNSNIEVEYGCGINTNDNCGNGYQPHDLVLGETITANNEFATTSMQTPGCNDVANRKDVWFAVDAGDLTTIDIFLQAGFYMQLWDTNTDEPDCFNLTQVENACGGETLVDIPVTPNNFYFIQVWNDDTTEDRGGSSWFDLTVQDGALSTSESVFQEFKIFPNPTNGMLNLESNLKIDSIKLYNVIGQEVMSIHANIDVIDMSIFEQGMYFVQVEIDGKTSTYKVLKK